METINVDALLLVKYVSEAGWCSKSSFFNFPDGICHVYVDKSADMEMAKNIVVDAKTDYPAACNAMDYLFLTRFNWYMSCLFQPGNNFLFIRSWCRTTFRPNDDDDASNYDSIN